MKQACCFCTQDICSFGVSSSLQGSKNKGKRAGSKHSAWEHGMKQQSLWVQEFGRPSTSSWWLDCSLAYTACCMILESTDYFGTFWPASQNAFCKFRHWEQTGALNALGCWRHPLLRLETLLQENLLGSLLAENQVCHGLKLFFIISHDLKLFKSAVKRLLGAVHLGLTVTYSSVLMETNLWTARKASAEEEAGLRACSKVTVGKSNVSYLTCCCSQRQGFWLSKWCLSTKPQVRMNSFSEVSV